MGAHSKWTPEKIRRLDEILKRSKRFTDFMAEAVPIAGRSPSYAFWRDRKKGTLKIGAMATSPLGSNHQREPNKDKPSGATDGNDATETAKSSAPNSSGASSARPLSESDVVVGQSAEKVESSDIKEIYKNMLKEEIAGDKPSKITTQSTTSGGETETSTKVTTPIANKYTASPGNLLATMVKSVDNNLFYGENGLVGSRKLSADEEANIDAAASALPLSAFDGLDDPWVNFLIAGFAIPAINRTDLIVEKVRERTAGFKGFKVKVPKRDVFQSDRKEASGETVVHEAPAQSPTPAQSNAPVYNDAQQAQLQQWGIMGFKIDPRYDFGLAIDYTTMTNQRIIRNVGSIFNG